MDVTDVRVGNLVLDSASKTVRRVSGFQGNTIFIQPEPAINDTTLIPKEVNGNYSISPIPITEKWLERFGFVKYYHEDRDSDYYWKGEILIYAYRTGELYFASENDNGCYPIVNTSEIKYVHELQNLYFALIKEEVGFVSSRAEKLAEFEEQLLNAALGDSIFLDQEYGITETDVKGRINNKCIKLGCKCKVGRNKNILTFTFIK